METDLYTILYLAPIIIGILYIFNIFWGDNQKAY